MRFKQKGCGQCTTAHKDKDKIDLYTVGRRTTTRQNPSGIWDKDQATEEKPAHLCAPFIEINVHISDFTACKPDVSRLIHGIASLIMKIVIQTWQFTLKQSIKLNVDATSLDSVTRQLPDGYYSTFRTYDRCTRVLGLKSHLRRLYDPIPTPDVNASDLRQGLIRLLEPFRPDEARVRVMITKLGQVYAAIEPLKPLPPEVYENGVRVETTEIQRESPRLKSTAFIRTSDSERKHIAREGIFEALLLKNENILEGMTSNFFYVKTLRAERSDERSSRSTDEAQVAHQSRALSAGLRLALSPSAQREVLFTAQRDVLLGVTRRTIIRLARGRGLEVKYRALKLNQLSEVNETFITSSSRGVVPVIQIDEVTIGQGRPGQITQMLMSAYDQYVLEHAEEI